MHALQQDFEFVQWCSESIWKPVVVHYPLLTFEKSWWLNRKDVEKNLRTNSIKDEVTQRSWRNNNLSELLWTSEYRFKSDGWFRLRAEHEHVTSVNVLNVSVGLKPPCWSSFLLWICTKMFCYINKSVLHPHKLDTNGHISLIKWFLNIISLSCSEQKCAKQRRKWATDLRRPAESL